jgi:hypothetical protein
MASLAETGTGRTGWRLSWTAVIAGALLAIAAHVVLGLIGAALGLAAAPADSKGLGAGAGIWALLTPFVATAVGAWFACRLAAASDDATGNAHGILVWCIGLIAGALFLAGTLASGAMSAGTASSGNAGAAQRALRGELGGAPADRTATNAPGATREQARARADDAAKAAATAAGGGALASIAGLIGALVGSALSRRRRHGKGLGWRLALQRRDERHVSEHGAATSSPYMGTGAPPYPERTETSRQVRGPGEPPLSEPGGPADPYQH